MRWTNLRVDGEEQAPLPGYRDPAVVRRFDAPEALDTRFYEVRAKSALNRVPESSAVPFRWTINPYRGCTHACLYCADGDTDVLLADGRARKLRHLLVGDAVYGTQRVGHYRRFVRTAVLAHWRTRRKAYRVALADGTELITSGDHRFLTERGWKHVVGDGRGPDCRPHLTTNNSLLGFGRTSAPPKRTPAYERGYLAGMIRGDGLLASYTYERPNRAVDRHHRFRLALADTSALDRSEDFLFLNGVDTTRREFSSGTEHYRPLTAIGTSRGAAVERVESLIAWPLDPSDDWRKGFLAGIFDAEGSCSGPVARIANADPEILARVVESLRHFGFATVLEPAQPNGVSTVRFLGGLPERMRFFHLVDPAITRKREFEGQAIKNDGDLRVVSVEPLGLEMPMYDITTGTGDFIANGVVSHNCFARPTHEYLGWDAGRDFEREIVVKVNVPELVRAELARPSWRGEHVALGTNTDPYQWVEGRYELMPGIWRAMLDARNPCSVLTKSPLLLRDIELLAALARTVEFSAALSVPTLDEKAWRASEPRTPNPRARLEAVRELNRAGVPTGILVAPLMPGINDAPEQVEEILAAAAEAGAVSVGGIALHVRGSVRGVFMDWLASYRPDLVPRYEELYRRGAYAPKAERRRLAALVGGDDPLEPGERRRRRFGLSAPGEVIADGAQGAARRRARGPDDGAQAATRRRARGPDDGLREPDHSSRGAPPHQPSLF